MKSNSKIIILLIFGFFLAVSSITSINNFRADNVNNGMSVEDNDNTTLKSLKQAGYWNNFSFIHIDGNWSTAAGYAWCSGDGSWGNPYTIENITIDATSSVTRSGIYIINSKNDYFIIRNCTVYNSGSVGIDAGIKLENTNNGMLTNNNCSNNRNDGILLLSDCDNNTISGNIVSDVVAPNQEVGIELNQGCDGNTISGNTASYNTWFGIILDDSCINNTILENTVTYNDDSGIRLSTDCDNNTISGNIANENWGHGIELDDCGNNIVSGNNIYENHFSGIYLDNCNDSIISRNTARNFAGLNQDYGIRLVNGASNNTISGNLMKDNGVEILISAACQNNLIYLNTLRAPAGWQHASDFGTNNYWNNSMVGNYWDNHTSPDSDNDGIVDTPFIGIAGTALINDSLPLAESPVHEGEKIHIDDTGVSAWNWDETAKLKFWKF